MIQDINFHNFYVSGTHFGATASDLARLMGIKQIMVVAGMIDSDEPDITPESRQLFVRSYLETKYDDPSQLTEEEIELFDISTRWLEISNNCKGMPFMFMDFGLKRKKEIDWLKIVDAVVDDYNRDREELPKLRERYLQLTNKPKQQG